MWRNHQSGGAGYHSMIISQPWWMWRGGRSDMSKIRFSLVVIEVMIEIEISARISQENLPRFRKI